MPSEDRQDRLIIESVTLNDKKFRPGDWIERIATLWAEFGRDRRLRYSPALYPCMIGGAKCLVVARALQQQDPRMFEFVLQFASQNQLRVQEDRRGELQAPTTEQRSEAWDYRYFEKTG